MTSSNSLDDWLRSQNLVWRGLQIPDTQQGIPTGFPELDALLPGGGWPTGALLQLDVPRAGSGELALFLPAMAALSRQGRRIVWLAPPYRPYAPGLQQAGVELAQLLVVACANNADLLWALEKLLRTGCCGMTLTWPTKRLAAHQTRRLQLAAEAGNALAVVFTGPGATTGHAALNMALHPQTDGVLLEIRKARGSLRQHRLLLAF
ncbi:translesion DNA synthesis-associated protein ImuA [Methylomonas sp. SURF-2]|uniref:Translesion DNA synthesis-associated protein ImuA n=1 Tax=Methylomonas subterranea TaxID=2952225 RepID=A0ABT1TKQ6_9GAMM|nr:translesion DNA synthesis-associated protein ImuA [Methylomonas sp. SURF-2]MCQ8106035.1 translesion DNA synthesis-associated protein ImuA [Methylomonas sp. SURF-2]